MQSFTAFKVYLIQLISWNKRSHNILHRTCDQPKCVFCISNRPWCRDRWRRPWIIDFTLVVQTVKLYLQIQFNWLYSFTTCYVRTSCNTRYNGTWLSQLKPIPSTAHWAPWNVTVARSPKWIVYKLVPFSTWHCFTTDHADRSLFSSYKSVNAMLWRTAILKLASEGR